MDREPAAAPAAPTTAGGQQQTEGGKEEGRETKRKSTILQGWSCRCSRQSSYSHESGRTAAAEKSGRLRSPPRVRWKGLRTYIYEGLDSTGFGNSGDHHHQTSRASAQLWPLLLLLLTARDGIIRAKQAGRHTGTLSRRKVAQDLCLPDGAGRKVGRDEGMGGNGRAERPPAIQHRRLVRRRRTKHAACPRMGCPVPLPHTTSTLTLRHSPN